MESIRISIIQTDIVWENKQENLRLLHEKLQSLRGITEIVVLPEMFSTGFSMQSKILAEPIPGNHYNTQTMGRQIPASHLRKLYSNRERTVL